MASTTDIIRDVESLPVEERARIVDSLLRSLNQPDPTIDRQWAAVARRRREELQSGSVKTVSAEKVFAEIRRRFGA